MQVHLLKITFKLGLNEYKNDSTEDINIYRFSCLNKTLGLSYSQTSPLIKFEPFML